MNEGGALSPGSFSSRVRSLPSDLRVPSPVTATIVDPTNLRQDLVISPMLPRHVSAVARIEKESHPDPWSERAFLEELTLFQSTTLVALRTLPRRAALQSESAPFPSLSSSQNLFFEEILGYICFWCVADEFQILNVTVAPHQRGRGIGSRLLEQALQHGRERGARIAVLEVRKTNTTALRFYQKAGFRIVGERPGYYRVTQESALLLQKELDG